MSILPKIPYTMRKNKSQVVAMRGINYSNVTQDGDIADSKGISARSYPYITTRKAREKQGQYSNVTAMTVFNNKIVVVADGKLYWGGQEIGELTPGEKQFAPINTKLCIMPDKKYFDSQTMTLEDMGADLMGYGAIYTSNSVTLKDELRIAGTGQGGAFKGNTFTINKKEYFPMENRVMVFSQYWKNYSDFDPDEPDSNYEYLQFEIYEKVWAGRVNIAKDSDGFDSDHFRFYNAEEGYPEQPDIASEYRVFLRCFDKTHFSSLYHLKESQDSDGTYFYDSPSLNWTEASTRVEVYKKVSNDEFFTCFPFDSWINVNLTKQVNHLVHDTTSLEEGFFRITSAKEAGGVLDAFGISVELSTELEIKLNSGTWDPCSAFECDISSIGWDISLNDIFKVGQKVLFNGTYDSLPLLNYTKKISNDGFDSVITKVTETSLMVEDIFTDEESPYSSIELFVNTWDSGVGGFPDLTSFFKKGDLVSLSGNTTVFNNKSFIISKVENMTLYANSDVFEEAEEVGIVRIERKIPDLDYICSSENRIWGCSNKDNTIYASALGDPTNFFVNAGISTDSYAVAVGSEGRFTACCRFGSSVLFWKETKLHKILGSYPSEYTMYSYDFEGVQEGSHKSLQIINEVLYYKGIHGIYAFDSSPTLISSNFGDKYFTDAVAGVDGDSYYISMRGEDERDYLFVYETLPGLWVLEDDVKVFDFARIGKDMYMLTEGGEFYLCGAKDTETGMEWQVQLTPFYETVEGRKTYSRLLLRVELPQGSYLRVEVRADGRAWREAGKIVGKRQDVVPVLIPVNRCDKFEIRLSGKGKCTVMSILREFYIGGER